jgi:hypothetical protein
VREQKNSFEEKNMVYLFDAPDELMSLHEERSTSIEVSNLAIFRVDLLKLISQELPMAAFCSSP